MNAASARTGNSVDLGGKTCEMQDNGPDLMPGWAPQCTNSARVRETDRYKDA